MKYQNDKTNAFAFSKRQLKGLRNKVNSLVEMDSVDVIFYINLANREDRCAHFLEQIPALSSDMSKIIRIDAIYNKNGALGCTHSHIKAIETFLENLKWKTCIIFEDDFTFYNDSPEYNNSLLHKFFTNFTDWDMLHLSTNQTKPAIPTAIPEINKVVCSQTSSGYLIHKESAPKILANFKESADLLEYLNIKTSYSLDIYWEKLNLVRYAFNPNMGYQYPSISDIENRFVTYGC